jgi:hypothetical protein
LDWWALVTALELAAIGGQARRNKRLNRLHRDLAPSPLDVRLKFATFDEAVNPVAAAIEQDFGLAHADHERFVSKDF